MIEIKMNEVKQELEMLNKKFFGIKRMNDEIRKEIINLGYELVYLGTGRSAYTTSMQIKEMDVISKKYENGKFLSIGCFNIKHRGSVIYRAYVKKIV